MGLKDSEIWETISYVKNVSTSNFAGKKPKGDAIYRDFLGCETSGCCVCETR